MRAMSVCLFLLLPACDQGVEPVPSPASLSGAAAEAPVPPPAADIAGEDEEDLDALRDRLEDLELQMVEMSLAIEQMRASGIGVVRAEDVSYQPNRTTLQARTAQEALDEIWASVHSLEGGQIDMGPPGEGLFDLENGPLGPRRGNKPPPDDARGQGQARPEHPMPNEPSHDAAGRPAK